MNCRNFQDLMLDFVFGLLDEPEANAVREHIAACAACAAAFESAKLDQNKFGRAALAIKDIAPFELPAEHGTETSPAPQEPAKAPAPVPPKRGIRRITFVAWAATIACCVVVASTLTLNHREQVTSQEERVAKLIRERDRVEVQLASLPANFADQQKKIPAGVSTDALQVHVAGSSTAVPGVSANYQVAIRTLEGEAKAGVVDIEFTDPQDANKSIKAGSFATNNGVVEVPFPAELAAKPGVSRMRVTGRALGKDVGVVEESIQIPERELAAHLATNKNLYRPGDQLQARALLLDRFSLQPATAGMTAKLSLLDVNRKAIVPSVEVTTVAGIGAGEFKLPANLAEGTYIVEVRGSRLAPVSRTIEVLPATAPPVEVVTQNYKFRANQPIEQSVQILNRDGSPAANTPVFGNANVYDQKADANGEGRNGANLANAAQMRNTGQATYGQNRSTINFQGQTDAAGKYVIKLPGIADSQSGRQQLQADITYGADKKDKAKLVRELQVQPARVVVDFYPEGGRLIAGTPNRVFYRVRAPDDNAPTAARFTIEAGTSTIFDTKSESTVGSFVVTPDAKVAYSLKIVSPGKGDVRDPFASLGIQNQGIVLRGDAVQAGPGPLRVSLENRGEPRLIQIIATSRGQVVAHFRTQVTDVALPLELPISVDGVIRVTALEVKDGQFIPLNERLFFRNPARTLDISVQTVPGDAKQAVELKVQGRNEHGQPLAFWSLAGIVDDRFRGDAPESSLATHFLLMGDAPADVDLSELPVVGVESSPRDLELVLGVFGWRRVGHANPATPTALGKRDPQAAAQRAPLANAAGPSFFYRVEPNVSELRERIQNQRDLAQLALREAARTEQARLVLEKTEVARQLSNARAELDEMQKQPLKQIMAAMGILAVVMLGAAILGMFYGLSLLLRRRSAAFTFGVSCGCLAGCLALLVMRPEEAPDNRSMEVAANKQRPLDDFPLDRRIADAPRSKSQRSTNFRFESVEKGELVDGKAMEAIGERPAASLPADGMLAAGNLRQDGEQLARLDQSRQALVRELSQGEMKRGTADDRVGRAVVLKQLRSDKLDRVAAGAGGFVGGLGGGAGGPSAPAPGLAPPMAMPTSPKAAADSVTTKADSKANAPRSGSPGGAPAAMMAPKMAESAARDGKAEKDLAKRLDETESIRIDVNNLPRQLAARRAQELSDPATLLWNPALLVPATSGSVSVDLPARPARYRVFFLGHTEDGRLGIYDGILNSK